MFFYRLLLFCFLIIHTCYIRSEELNEYRNFEELMHWIDQLHKPLTDNPKSIKRYYKQRAKRRARVVDAQLGEALFRSDSLFVLIMEDDNYEELDRFSELVYNDSVYYLFYNQIAQYEYNNSYQEERESYQLSVLNRIRSGDYKETRRDLMEKDDTKVCRSVCFIKVKNNGNNHFSLTFVPFFEELVSEMLYLDTSF